MTLRIEGIPFVLALIIFFGMHMWPVLLIIMVFLMIRSLLRPFHPPPPDPTVRRKVDSFLRNLRKL